MKIMKNYVSFAFFVFFLLSVSIYAYNAFALSCAVRASCNADETCLFSKVTANNSHAGDCNAVGYLKICCTNISSSTVRSSCNADEGGVIALLYTANSHAEDYSQGNYPNKVCAKFTDYPISCSVQSSCDSATEACVASIYQSANSHVAECGYYGNQICCGKLADLYVNQSSITQNVSSPNEGDGIKFTIEVFNLGDRAAPNVNVSCYYNGTYFSSDIINSVPPDPSAAQPRYANCTWTTLAGTWNISAYVDPDNDIQEYNEDNNEAWKWFTVNAYPVVSEPAYNVTPAEIERGDGIEITCVVTDVEDSADDLTVNISIQQPNGTWSNETVGHISGTFFRNYSTDLSSLLGNYTAVCSAVDTNNAYAQNSSIFLIWANMTISINLNATEVEWGGGLSVSGQAIYRDIGYVNASPVEVKVEGKTKCTDTTDDLGNYGCDFSAPSNVGTFTLIVELTDIRTGKLFTNSTTFTVKEVYGAPEAEAEMALNVGCYEVPKIVQNPDGTIERSTVRICVWQ